MIPIQFLDAARVERAIPSSKFSCVYKGTNLQGETVAYKFSIDHDAKAYIQDLKRQAIASTLLQGATSWTRVEAFMRINATELEKLPASPCLATVQLYKSEYGTTEPWGGDFSLNDLRTHPKMTAQDIKAVVFDIVWALYTAGALHGIHHGDLKPSNVVISASPTDTTRYIKRADGWKDAYIRPPSQFRALLIDLQGVSVILDRGGNPVAPFQFASVSTPNYTIDKTLPVVDRIAGAADLFSLGMLMCFVAAIRGNLDQTHFVMNGESPPLRTNSVMSNDAALICLLLDIGHESAAFANRKDLTRALEEALRMYPDDDARFELQETLRNFWGVDGLDLIQRITHPSPKERMMLSSDSGISLDRIHGFDNVLAHPYFSVDSYIDKQTLESRQSNDVWHDAPLSLQNNDTTKVRVLDQITELSSEYDHRLVVRENILSRLFALLINGESRDFGWIPSDDADIVEFKELLRSISESRMGVFTGQPSRSSIYDKNLFWNTDTNPRSLIASVSHSKGERNAHYVEESDDGAWSPNFYFAVLRTLIGIVYVAASSEERRTEISATYEKIITILKEDQQKRDLADRFTDVLPLVEYVMTEDESISIESMLEDISKSLLDGSDLDGIELRLLEARKHLEQLEKSTH